jgi:hypothetical protein
MLATTTFAVTLVTPSERVSTRLQVREHPSAADTVVVVGKLLKNETAEWLGAVPSWYHVRLDNGVVGYVHKAWSDTFTTDVGRRELQLRLGAWNVKKLGHGQAKDHAAVARIIEAHFDVVALVEVMQKQGEHAGLDSVLARLGDRWDHVVTSEPRPNTTSGSAEFYAVLFRSKVARVGDGWTGLRYATDNDGGPDGTGADAFSREPAYVFLDLLHPDGTVACDVLLGVYHAVWAGGDADVIGAEVAHVDAVLSEMAGSASGERDVWLVGDFNLVGEDLAPLTAATSLVVGTGSTLNQVGEITANLYDHLLVRDLAASTELVGEARVLDVRPFAIANDVFYGSVSDHLPIVVPVHAVVDDD